MKTAISMADALFVRVDSKASQLGVSRSEFLSTAAERYLRSLAEQDLTARMNAAVAAAGPAGEREQHDIARAGAAILAGDDEW